MVTEQFCLLMELVLTRICTSDPVTQRPRPPYRTMSISRLQYGTVVAQDVTLGESK